MQTKQPVGRPRIKDAKIYDVQCKVEESLFLQVNDAAIYLGMSRSSLVRDAICNYLKSNS